MGDRRPAEEEVDHLYVYLMGLSESKALIQINPAPGGWQIWPQTRVCFKKVLSLQRQTLPQMASSNLEMEDLFTPDAHPPPPPECAIIPRFGHVQQADSRGRKSVCGNQCTMGSPWDGRRRIISFTPASEMRWCSPQPSRCP